MRKFYFISFLTIFFLASCEDLTEDKSILRSQELITPELKATIINGIVSFESFNNLKSTVSYLIENTDYSFSSMETNFKSFQEARIELEKSEDKPKLELFEKFFREVEIDGEVVIMPKITDVIFEKILNSEGYVIIKDELYSVQGNSIFKQKNKVSEGQMIKVSDIKLDIQRLNSFESNASSRGINGGGNWMCNNKEYRLIGDLMNFNIGIYQRLSIQVKYQRKNQSFWSWLDPWLAEDGSLFYNASFNIQPAGGPTFNVYLTDSCGWCSGFNRTVDVNIFAPATEWSNQSGTFGGTVACGYRTYNF